MIGIVMTIHNRPGLTQQSLDSLKGSQLHAHSVIILVDDGSDEETQKVINDFSIDNTPIIKFRMPKSIGVKLALQTGVDFAFIMGCDVVTNLDNDVKLKPDWLKVLQSIYNSKTICTAFHSTTKNLDGSERHKILSSGEGWAEKESFGGINMMFDEEVYKTCIEPSLLSDGNWDHQSSINARRLGYKLLSTVPSYIQHTGTVISTMGHSENPDVADGFYDLDLSTVTLIGVDCVDFQSFERAANICTRDIHFGGVKLLTHFPSQNKNVVRVNEINSKEKYSEFIIKELHKYVDTPYMLIFQSDGYILNPEAWTDEFLNYDYIGATWGYKDNRNVGNGGFSLRSKKLMEAVSKLCKEYMPEDYQICRAYRSQLEAMGFKFAPEELANKFAIEAYSVHGFEGANKYGGQFGFHGWNVDFSTANLSHIPKNPKQPLRVRRHSR